MLHITHIDAQEKLPAWSSSPVQISLSIDLVISCIWCKFICLQPIRIKENHLFCCFGCATCDPTSFLTKYVAYHTNCCIKQHLSMLSGVYNNIYQCHQGCTTTSFNVIRGVQQPLSMSSGVYNNLYQYHQGCTTTFINIIRGVQQPLSMLSGKGWSLNQQLFTNVGGLISTNKNHIWLIF